MAKFVKCPRCDLNYMPVGDKLCKVCLQEVKGVQHEEVEMCSICKEFPALPGRDVCLMCLKDMEGTPSDAETEAQADIIAEVADDDISTEADDLPVDAELDNKLMDAENELKSVEALVEEESKEMDNDDEEEELD